MNRVELWLLVGLVALTVSLVAIWAHRRGVVWSLLATASVLVLLEALVVWDRTRKLHTVYRYEEPLFTSVLVTGIPVMATAAAVTWAASSGWKISSQVLVGIVTGTGTFLVSVLLGYSLL
jgi:hypothetical protein